MLGRQREAEHTHDERDVLEHRKARNQPEVLKHEADAAAVVLHLGRAKRLQIAAEHLEIAFARQIFAQQQAQERRLAGAARTREENELGFVDREGEIAQRVDAAVVGLRKM